MKKLIFFAFILSIMSCSAQKNIAAAVKDPSGNLIGVANKENFLEAPFNEWFTPNYASYETDKEVMAKLTPLL
jgi:hypothetical protein